ncbi:MAG TPA: alpha/beta fold hydrolase [Pyrinomonadaceae bacterium]|jgi:pimeloyl-ACP methyl ester carboxylesterase|nr:alpha/beta fold hydrolase [Pyrinomonadaceae bacterium]
MPKFNSGASRKIAIPFMSLVVFALGVLTIHAAPRRSALPSTIFPQTLQTAPAQSEGTATIYGVRIHYVEAGSGPVVVLLHGLGGNTTNWAFNIAPLAQKYRVVVLDQIGFGQSDKPLINYRIATYVDFLDAFLKELKIERASFVGNSMGGWVAAAYALAHPEKVERLVLVDAAGFSFAPDFDTSQLIKLNPSTREGMKELISRVFYNKQIFMNDAFLNASMAARINAGDGHTIRSITESIIRREDFLDNRLSVIKQPTLVIWGREDGLLPLADGQRFQKEIPGAQLLVFEQCGHVPQVEKAMEFNAAVLKFLAAPASSK